MLTILVAIIVIILLSEILINALSGFFGFSFLAGKGLFSLIKKLLEKIRGKEVTVICPRCPNRFRARPKKKNSWIVTCPQCGSSLRVDTRKKKPVTK